VNARGPIAGPPPAQPAEQLQWLVDRARISDLLVDFARCLDVRDWDRYIANFTERALLVLPFRTFHGREEIAGHATHGLDAFEATQHVSTNHVIELKGDEARTRSYLIGTHIPKLDDPAHHGDAGGWYDCELRRTPEGWRFERVELHVKWRLGSPLPGE
jgi:SnoaL-like domain